MSKKHILLSATLSAILLGGCMGGSSGGGDNLISIDPTTISIDPTTGDALAKKLDASALAEGTNLYLVSANTEIIDDDYTYNFSTKGGIIATQSIDWTSASQAKSNILSGDVDEDDLASGYVEDTKNYGTTCTQEAIGKPIPKVICDSTKDLCMVYNITCLTDDITVAVTPYLSTLAMPGAASFVYSNNQEPLTKISADVSVRDSSGNRLTPSQIQDKVTLTAKIVAKNTGLETDTYSLYKVQSANTDDPVEVLLTNTNGKLTSLNGAIDGFYPYIIAKDAIFDEYSGILQIVPESYSSQSLAKTLSAPIPLAGASIMAFDGEDKILATTTTTPDGNYSFKTKQGQTIAKIRVYSNLLANGMIEQDVSGTLLSINIDEANLSANYPTSFSYDEQSAIKELLGKKIYSDFTEPHEPLRPQNFVAISDPKNIVYSNYGYGLIYNMGLTISTAAQSAIDSFIKCETVTNSNGQNQNGSYTYDIQATQTTLDIVLNKSDGTKFTVKITKKDPYNFDFVVTGNEVVNNTTTDSGLESTQKENESFSISWSALFDKPSTSGYSLSKATNGKFSKSWDESMVYKYNGEISSQTSSKGGESGSFNLSKSLANTYIVSAVANLNDTSSDLYHGSQTVSLDMKAKYGFSVEQESNIPSYNMTNSANISIEKLNYTEINHEDEQIVNYQDIYLDVVKNSVGGVVMTRVNGVDASSWPKLDTPPTTPDI